VFKFDIQRQPDCSGAMNVIAGTQGTLLITEGPRSPGQKRRHRYPRVCYLSAGTAARLLRLTSPRSFSAQTLSPNRRDTVSAGLPARAGLKIALARTA